MDLAGNPQDAGTREDGRGGRGRRSACRDDVGTGQGPGWQTRHAPSSSGGNIDPVILSRVIEKGLVHDGRLTRFTVTISDRPGGLAELCRVIAASGASVNQIDHDRAFSGPDVGGRRLSAVETRDRGIAALTPGSRGGRGFRT